MRTTFLLLAMLVGLAIAFLLYVTVPAIRDMANRARQRFYLWNLRMLADIGGATMVAGTAVVRNDKPAGHHFTGTFNLDAGNLVAGAREVETVVIPGLAVGDVVIVRNRTTRALIVSAEKVSAADNLEFALENNTAGAIDTGNDLYDYAVIRGSTMALR